MTRRFYDLTFGPSVLEQQACMGSRAAYAMAQSGGSDPTALMTRNETTFLAARDSFYLASITQKGWPYVQHRGGAPGFVRETAAGEIGWAEFVGNRQYISAGNVAVDDRVAMIFVDYPNQQRLKILGHMTLHEPAARPDLARLLVVDGYRGHVERFILVKVEAFDWNCPQHIVPRFNLQELEQILTPLHARIAELEAKLKVSASDPSASQKARPAS